MMDKTPESLRSRISESILLSGVLLFGVGQVAGVFVPLIGSLFACGMVALFLLAGILELAAFIRRH